MAEVSSVAYVLQGSGDNVRLVMAGDSLDGRCFATSGLPVEQETEHVGGARLLVRGRVVKEYIDFLHPLLIPWEVYVVNCCAALKAELSVVLHGFAPDKIVVRLSGFKDKMADSNIKLVISIAHTHPPTALSM